MDGRRIRNYLSNDVEAMLKAYRQFEILIPAKTGKGAAHRGEDGTYVEALLKTYIKKYLPKDLEVFTGFILRPALKEHYGEGGGRARGEDEDQNSTQLDIIIYDTAHYPVYQRIEEHVIVPPEGVIAVISVKKNLYLAQAETEFQALEAVGKLCTGKNSQKEEVKGPFLALVAMDTAENGSSKEQGERLFSAIEGCFPYKGTNRYDWLPGCITVLSRWSVKRGKPKPKEMPKLDEKRETEGMAEYIMFDHEDGEAYFGFQILLKGILDVYYDKTRGNSRNLGFTAFEPGRGYDRKLGEIPYIKEHGDRAM